MAEKISRKIGAQELILETGDLARQANGAVLARYAGSVVLATVCCDQKKMEDVDYLPLSVEYNEKYYAAGKIPGGFLKREGRPRDKEVLVSRLIDRPIRPLFPKNMYYDIQVIPTTISADQINPPDVVAMVAASAAITISDIPFSGPIGAVRVGYLDNQFIINPTFEERDRCMLDIVVAGTEQSITMVEGGAKEVSEEIMIQAIKQAHIQIKEICKMLNELKVKVGKQKFNLPAEEAELGCKNELWDWAYPQLEQACFVQGKMNRSEGIKKTYEQAAEKFKDKIAEENINSMNKLLEEMETEIVRKSILEKKLRTDGRGLDDIRPISCEIDILPRTHGSALFTRGETQALVVTTLGTVYDEQIMDDIEGDTRKTFMLHYNFPPFSVGETGRLSASRRAVGHGNLAERAIETVLPEKEVFPYTIRIVSEILESNGSSSMATVCGASLTLLNAGVPIKNPVAGIAMGLIKENDKYMVLTDILGVEDHLGDMDFKVAGTEAGITAFQMDIKIAGVSYDILRDALEKAKVARNKILDTMNQTINKPRSSISDYAPKIITMKIKEDKIGAVIGPGGKSIKGISEQTEATINIENDGSVTIYCKNKDGAEQAKKMISEIIEEPKIGKVYKGKVKRIMDFGAFIEFLPGKEGLCHISKLSKERVRSVSDVLKLGDNVIVKIIEIDKMGRINLGLIDKAASST